MKPTHASLSSLAAAAHRHARVEGEIAVVATRRHGEVNGSLAFGLSTCPLIIKNRSPEFYRVTSSSPNASQYREPNHAE